MTFLQEFIEYFPASALFVCGAVFGAALDRLWRECRRFGQMTENQLLRWQNTQLLHQVERALQNSNCTVAQQCSDGSALLPVAVSRSEDG